MKKLFNDPKLINFGCWSKDRYDQIRNNKTEMTLEEILSLDFSVKDKIWFVRNNCELTIKQNQLLALEYAKISLKFYTEKYPNDTRVSDCIDATYQYIEGNCTIDFLKEKKNAAYSAAAAADADAIDAASASAAAAAYTAIYAAESYAYVNAAYATAEAAEAAEAYAYAAAAYAAADAAAYAAAEDDADVKDNIYTNDLLQMLKDLFTN